MQTSNTDERLRVLHILRRLDKGESERQLLLLLKNYNSLRFVYHVLAFEASADSTLREQIERLGIPVTVLPEDCTGIWQRYNALRAFLTEFGAHLVHSWNFRTNAYAGIVGARSGVDVRLGSLRSSFQSQKLGRLSPVARVLGLRSVERQVVPRTSLVEELRQRGMADERVFLIPEAIEALAPPGRLDLSDLGIQRDARLVGIVGDFSSGDRIEMFIKAMARLLPRQPGVHGLIVGEPKALDHYLVTYLEEEIESLGLADKVTVSGPRSDILLLLMHLEALCVTSAGDELPLPWLRAMAAATPIVGVREGALPDLVQDGVSGMLVGIGDSAAMADSLDLILSERALAKELGNSARRAVVDARGSHHMAHQLEDLYCQLLAEKWEQEWNPDE